MRTLPLEVEIKNYELVIHIGLESLAYAADQSDLFNPYDPEKNNFVRQFQVSDAEEWAKDINRELTREEEDGSSMLTNLFDKAFEKALDQASLGVKELTNA
jgi:hypothetical protein